MSNCIAKTCGTKLLGTPLLKTHRRVSAKCVTYSGTAWKFQQAQRNALLRWNVVCRYSSMKTHFQLTSSRTNFNTLHRKTSLWHEDSWFNCLRQHRCVRGQRVMLSHSMEISASLTKSFADLGSLCNHCHQDTQKDLAMLFQKTQGKEGKPRKATFVTQRFLGHNC